MKNPTICVKQSNNSPTVQTVAKLSCSDTKICNQNNPPWNPNDSDHPQKDLWDRPHLFGARRTHGSRIGFPEWNIHLDAICISTGEKRWKAMRLASSQQKTKTNWVKCTSTKFHINIQSDDLEWKLLCKNTWGFPKMGVKTPKWMVYKGKPY